MIDARLYLVAPARLAAADLHELVPDLAGAGVDIIQLREKELEAGDVLRLAAPVAAACRAVGVPFVVNDRVDIAVAVGADGVHVGQNDLPAAVARRILPSGLVGLSTHTPAEVDRAAVDADIDYFAVGPVYETPTKQGRPAAGIELIRDAAARGIATPWFAIGGIDLERLPRVIEAGARRVVVVRAIAQAPDPAEAAARLRALLDDAPAS